MFAIVQLGSHQYQVTEKNRFKTEKVEIDEGKTFTSEKILLLGKEKGSTVIGTPYVKDAAVEFKVIEHGKGDKIRVFKMKSKKRYRRTKGHRQLYSELEVLKILEKTVPKAEVLEENTPEVEKKRVVTKKTKVEKMTVKEVNKDNV